MTAPLTLPPSPSTTISPTATSGTCFEQAYDDCYRPLVDALAESPHVQMALHHTGAAARVDRARAARLLRQAAHAGRARAGRAPRRRLLRADAGGPARARRARADRDDVATTSRRTSACGPRACGWPSGCGSRRWRKLIADAGMKFTLVDDGHFRAAGLDGHAARLLRHREGGHAARALPHRQDAARGDPVSQGVGDDRRARTSCAPRPDRATPRSPTATTAKSSACGRSTKEWVWEHRAGWRDFFRRSASGRARCVQDRATSASTCESHRRRGGSTCRRRRTRRWASGRCRPTRSGTTTRCARRSRSAASSSARAPFFRGGIWQSFLAKYPEANFMHKKMVRVSDKLERAEEQARRAREPAPLDHARRELYRAQCNCGYWHGLFGGLYLNYLRDAVYHHLIDAEAAGRARARHRRRAAPRRGGRRRRRSAARGDALQNARGRRPT